MVEDTKTKKYALKKIPRKYRGKHGVRFGFVEMKERLQKQVDSQKEEVRSQ